MRPSIKKGTVMLLLVALLIGLLPAATRAEGVWDLMDCTMDDYTANWKTSIGSLVSECISQQEGYVNILKGDDKPVDAPKGGAYAWLVPNALTMPQDGPFTAQVNLRLAGPTTGNPGEISARFGTNSNDTNGRLYAVFINYGTTDGWIATNANGDGAVQVDTTQWHDYGLVVDESKQTYDVYLDGKLVINDAACVQYKGGNLFRIGVDNSCRTNMDVKSVKIGTGDLLAAQEAEVWTLMNSSMDNYTDAWKIQQGKKTAGKVTQENGYVKIVKTNEDEAQLGNPGPYIWLLPQKTIDLPTDQPFTAEVTARLAHDYTAKKTVEISARIGTGSDDVDGKLYPIYLKYGKTGSVSTGADGEGAVTLDTTLWHNYAIVVDHQNQQYDVYVDGELKIDDASATTYKGGKLFRMGLDSEARGDMDVKAVKIGAGDLSAYLTKAENPDAPVDPTPGGKWDLFDHEFFPKWDSEGFRQSTRYGSKDYIVQHEDYVNIVKPDSEDLSVQSDYHWVCSPASLKLPRDGFTFETTVRAAGSVEAQSNEISIRMGEYSEDLDGKLAAVFLGYGKEGYISANANGSGPYCVTIDTTVWHKLTYVVFPLNGAYYFDVYIDDVLTFDTVPLRTYKGADLVRFGADNDVRCNMDVQSARLATGFVLPEGASNGRITGITLSEKSQTEKEAKTITVSLEATEFEDGRAVTVSLEDKAHEPVAGVEATGSFKAGKAEVQLTIPAGLGTGLYYVKAESGGRSIRSEAYKVTADREAPVFPSFEPQGFTIEMDDYIYNPTEEFNFPCVVDTKEHPVSNELGNYRYYLFYAPHNAPAGCCVAASNSLDGPWVEYGSNPVVAKTWPKESGDGNYYNVSHVSSPHVLWNDVYNCWFMYFHGENNITRYATSDDLLHWTYGDICVQANDFSPSGSGFNEASYARVFEHEVPGLNNKYIMLLMITGTASGGHRNIYWAYSKDGKEWTAVKESLLDPTMDSIYQGNFSGPWFMEWDGRYYVICHATSGDMYAFEVGESLDELISWGVFYDSNDSINSDAEDESAYPDYGRSGAPCFIQDDEGRWHMFYEGGRRLHANIVHAVEHQHTWSDWEVTKPATCTEDGEQTRHCACGETQTQTLSALGHSYGPWKQTKAPTCEQEGQESQTCTVCGETQTRTVATTGHSWEKDYTVDTAPSCTQPGSKSIHCANCDAVKNVVPVPATGHTFKNGKCTVCGEKDPSASSEVPKTGDSSPILLWTVLTMTALIGMLGITILYTKKYRR